MTGGDVEELHLERTTAEPAVAIRSLDCQQRAARLVEPATTLEARHGIDRAELHWLRTAVHAA